MTPATLTAWLAEWRSTATPMTVACETGAPVADVLAAALQAEERGSVAVKRRAGRIYKLEYAPYALAWATGGVPSFWIDGARAAARRRRAA